MRKKAARRLKHPSCPFLCQSMACCPARCIHVIVLQRCVSCAGEEPPEDVQSALSELQAARSGTVRHQPADVAAGSSASAGQELGSCMGDAEDAAPGTAHALPAAGCWPGAGKAASPCGVLDIACGSACGPGNDSASQEHAAAQRFTTRLPPSLQANGHRAGTHLPPDTERVDWDAEEQRVRAAAAMMPARVDVLVADLLDFRCE